MGRGAVRSPQSSRPRAPPLNGDLGLSRKVNGTGLETASKVKGASVDISSTSQASGTYTIQDYVLMAGEERTERAAHDIFGREWQPEYRRGGEHRS